MYSQIHVTDIYEHSLHTGELALPDVFVPDLFGPGRFYFSIRETTEARPFPEFACRNQTS